MNELETGHPDYVNQTTLHPLGLAAVIILGCAMLLVPRRFAVWPMIIMASFVASAQRIVLFTLDFDLLRMMVLFGCLRIVSRNETRSFVWKRLDSVFLAWAASMSVIYTVREATSAALVNRLGHAFTAVGMYFLFRCLVRDRRDVLEAVRGFAIVSLSVAAAFLLENHTGRNLFAVFGGVPAITAIREGRLRCQGAFSHPVLAGCFWASLMPLIGSLWWAGYPWRLWAPIGLLASCVIVVCCASSTPLLAVVFAVVGALVWPLRDHMRPLRWGIALTLAGLHMVMNNPVWHLLARVNIVGGSTGWHRYYVIDQAIGHIGEWWLIGTSDIGHWGIWANDITNQYVAEAIGGGVLTLVLFIWLIVRGFRGVGRLRRQSRERGDAILAWALGVSLFVHCMNFIGGCYFGQIIMVWYWLLATIASLEPIRETAVVGRSCPRPSQPRKQGRWIIEHHCFPERTRGKC